MKKVVADYRDQECIISFENYSEKTANLDDYIDQLKGISTEQKWSTWGRTYVEIPVEVLKEFGIESNLPLVAYLNYVNCRPLNYCYSGSIFQGDAAWFDGYEDISQKEILNSASYEIIKSALENTDKTKKFVGFFNTTNDKWKEVPVWNPELAAIASAKNSSLT